jgi:hypothetical protein
VTTLFLLAQYELAIQPSAEVPLFFVARHDTIVEHVGVRSARPFDPRALWMQSFRVNGVEWLVERAPLFRFSATVPGSMRVWVPAGSRADFIVRNVSPRLVEFTELRLFGRPRWRIVVRALLVALLVAGCSVEPEGCVVESSQTDRFDMAPLDSLTYDVPEYAVEFRVAGNPNLSASPFVDTMWFSLTDDERNLDFFRGDELGADRLRAVPVGNASELHVDNAGGAYVTGAVVWTLERMVQR